MSIHSSMQQGIKQQPSQQLKKEKIQLDGRLKKNFWKNQCEKINAKKSSQKGLESKFFANVCNAL